MIEIEVRRATGAERMFDTYIGGRYLCTSTTPFRDSAILLMAEGCDPGEVLVMSRAGVLTCLHAPLGYLDTRITPKFATWRFDHQARYQDAAAKASTARIAAATDLVPHFSGANMATQPSAPQAPTTPNPIST